MTNTKPEYIIIDVREPYEYNTGHIEGAINIPSESLISGTPEIQNIPKDSKIIVYCRTGSRSSLAISLFKEMGFTNLLNGINQNIAKERFRL